MLQTADRVVTWRNADYITDEQVDEIAAAVPEEHEEEPVVVEEPAEEPVADEPAVEAVEQSDEAAEPASEDTE
jgi:hypothetical protein